ncbi:monofunctional biosynthetic peptidoglycan transglycosylase [Pigmentiphaga litoralis]|uniref:Biosynthetic peptidoglycan transglycosylase n=1 Tax=Pigmentiphaga litoralis TaxID=516702 RepID=A0A7Y9LPR4_9BURK|nr:monofunctional biosynthetic peptidoglycan transglycosylase [Pigmentiphaga litoralis]NYE25690.1 monofunctional biosynthetic peptidoglycan transglycosylase [Pigmentiphaga litoralis]NYE84810.1 monofunctional biosynthetic peptidoglycan transglycosylase [Pigmentiphaga litoralis]
MAARKAAASGRGTKTRKRGVVGTVFKILGVFLLLVVLYQAWLFGWVVWYAYQAPGSTSVMRSELSRLQTIDPNRRLQYQWVDYGRISNNLKRAAIAAEDANFIEHGGIDWDAIERAYEHNRQLAEATERALARGRKPPSKPVRGGSTITQQVAKNLFLSNSRNYVRKAQEVVITYMIETVMSKERILELYLNIAEWGEGVFGAEAAARHYFRTSASNLTAYQSARLASMLPRPRFYDQHPGSAYLASRTDTLVRRMAGTPIP